LFTRNKLLLTECVLVTNISLCK